MRAVAIFRYDRTAEIYTAAERTQFLGGGLELRQQHIAQYSNICIGFRLQTLGLGVALPSFIVFILRFLEGVTIVVIIAGHI